MPGAKPVASAAEDAKDEQLAQLRKQMELMQKQLDQMAKR
jgi:hypothetical protein